MVNEIGELLGWRGLVGAVVVYSILPYGVLRVALLLWPKDHPRRAEYDAEYDVVPLWRRPFWVADAVMRSIVDGVAARCAPHGGASARVRRFAGGCMTHPPITAAVGFTYLGIVSAGTVGAAAWLVSDHHVSAVIAAVTGLPLVGVVLVLCAITATEEEEVEGTAFCLGAVVGVLVGTFSAVFGVVGSLTSALGALAYLVVGGVAVLAIPEVVRRVSISSVGRSGRPQADI